MTQFFQNYFHFALKATIVILIVLAIRPLIRRFSKRIASLLWIVVFFRLLCPFTVEGPVPAFWNQWTEAGQEIASRDGSGLEAAGHDVASKGVTGLEAANQGGAGLNATDYDAAIQDGHGSDTTGHNVASKGVTGLEAANKGGAGLDVTGYDAAGQDASSQYGNELDATGFDAATQEGNGLDAGHDVASQEGVQDASSQDGNEQDVTGYDVASQDGAQDASSQDGNGQDVTDYDVAGQEGASATDHGQKVLDEWLAVEELPLETAKAPKEGFSLRKSYAAMTSWFQSVPGKCFVNVCGVIWAFGMTLCLLYGILLYVRLSRKLGEAIPAGEWNKYPVKSSDVSGVPMSFGILHPGIYVPAFFREDSIKKIEAREKEMILQHEATHLSRRDPLWKMLSLLALCVHWWNPLAWLCIRLFHQDMEMACDEGVLARIGQDKKKEYASALLHFAKRQSGLSLSAAFGESNAESRIKEVLKFKKTPIWLSILLTSLVVLLGGCLATKPREEGKELSSEMEALISEEDPSQAKEPDIQTSDVQKLYGAEQITEDGYYVYDSSEALQEGFGERFRDILLKDGKITEDDKFYSYPNVEHLGSGGNGKPAKRSGLLISSWPEGICISVDGNTTQYVACLNYYLDEGKYYLGDVEIMDNSKVETYDQAVLFNTFAGLTDSYLLQQDENIPRLFLDARNTFFDVMADTWKAKDPKRYEKLLDPVTAVIEVMRLQGGQGEVIAEQNYGKIVKYTFKDGKAVHYRVKKRGDEWMPYALVEYSRAIRERYPDEYVNQREFNEEEWLSGIQKTEDILRTATAAQLRKVSTQSKTSSDPCWEGGKEGDFTILDQITALDATLYGLYGDGGMVLRVGDKTYPLWMSWATLYHGPELYAGDYDGDGDIEYALVVITGTGTGVSKEGLYVIEIKGNEAEVHEFTELTRYEELSKRLTYEYDKKEKRLTLAIDKGNSEDTSYVGLFLEGRFPEDESDNWFAGTVGLGFGDQESMQPVDDDLFYESCGGIIFSAEGAPAWPQYEVSANLTCRVQYHADGSFTIGKITGEAEYYLDNLPQDEVLGEARGEEVILEQYADLTRDGVKDVIVTSVTYHEENKNQSWQERMNQYEGCVVRVYNGAYEGNVDKEQYADKGGYNVANAIWKRELADAHAVNGMVLLCKKDGKDYLLTGSSAMFQGVLDPEYHVFTLGEAGMEYEVETGRCSASVTAPEDVWDVEAMVNYAKKLDAWTKNATLLALTDVEYDDRIGGTFDASESWKCLYSTVQEIRDAMEYSGDQPGDAIPKIIPLKGMSNFEESLNSLHACWKACAEWITYGDNMHNILTDLQPGKNIYTCHLTHGSAPVTVTVDYQDAVNHASDEVLIEVKNLADETIWNTKVSIKNDGWDCYYLTIYEEQAYMIRYVPVHEVNGISEGYFKMFYLNERGEEQVICECSVSSKDSKDFEKDKAAFEETKDAHMGRMNLIIGVADGEIAIKQVR